MKKIVFSISMFLFAYSIQAQQTILVNESFNTIPSGWTVSPTSSWMIDSSYAVSSPNAIWGFIPNTAGDSMELISPWFDFTNYGYVFLQFSHICKVVSSDICNIKYQETVMPSWKSIPSSSYLGSNQNAYMNRQFSQESYANWIPGDSLAVPTNSWWKEEVFDLSNEVSYAQVRFKFTIKKGNVLGTQFAYGWLIDNFKIMASVYEIKPPIVKFLTNFGDTVYNTGPFTIRAKVATRTMAPIKKPVKLNVTYTYNNVKTYDTLIMTPVEGDSIYSAVIPQKIFGTSIYYNVYGEDTVGNNDYDYAGFVLKRTSGGTGVDSTQIGQSLSSSHVIVPFNVSGDGDNWCRTLYLSSDIGNASSAKLISGLAYHCNSLKLAVTRYHTQCYLKATSLTSVPGTCTVDPITEGATKVYQGTWTTHAKWNKFVLDKPFTLPPGSNLLVYWIDTSSLHVCSSSGAEETEWAYINSVGYSAMDCQYTNYACGKTNCESSEYSRPVVTMYFGGSADDTNSVALHAIESPGKHVLAGQITPIVSTIKNKGYANLDSCIIRYSVNGVQQTPVYWKGSLPDDFNSTDTIGYYTPRLNDYDTLVVWVSMPNGVVDKTTYDDTLRIITYGCSNLLNGDYVIGLNSGADFASIGVFFNILNLCGSSGNITLKLQNGVYGENVNILSLGNLMGNHTLTITSLSGNKDSVIFRPLTGVGITISNTDNLVIDGITVDAATNGTYAIHFASNCRNVVIRNNKLYAKDDVSNGSNIVINQQSSSGILDNIRISNNYIDGGYYGVYLYGKGSGIANYNTNIYVDSNEITNAYYYTTYFYYTSFKSISNNSISSGTMLKSGYFYGIRTYYCDIEKLCNNKIYTRTTMTNNYGIYSYYLNVSTAGMSNALYANNEIRLDGTLNCYGMDLRYSNVDVIHNSIYANSTSTTHGIYNYGTSANYIHNIRNNNIVCTYSSAYPIYITAVTALSVWTLDYNNYCAPTYVGYCAGAQSTISAWQSATSQDLHSVSIYPHYYNTNIGLFLLDDIGMQCPMDSLVMTDIKGEVRDTITTMGAYHFEANMIDVCPNKVLSPLSASIVGDSTPITIAVYNLGINTITSMNIGWKVNGVVQTLPYSWSGYLAQHDTVVVTIGYFIPQQKENILSVYTYAPNASNDEDVSNDTMIINTYGCESILSGTYTVGGTSADFSNVDDVMEVLQNCGVSGPVVFNFTSGNYGSMSFLSPIPGASKANTVTFTSISGNAKDVKIGSGGNALTLTDVEHLVFKNLTIGDTVGSTTYAVELKGMCNNIEINACNIYTSITSMSSSNVGIYGNNQNQPKYLKDIRILNNNIRGGYYNMYMYYICGNAPANMTSGSVTIDGNTLSDAYYMGIYNYYYSRYYSISNNKITSRSNSGGYYGIYSYYYTTIDTMKNNKIKIKCTSTAYGMNLAYYQNYDVSYGAKGPMYVANNEIIISTSGQGYGIYAYSNTQYSKFDIFHNSIYIASNSTPYGLYTYPVNNTTYKTICLNNNHY